MNENITTISAYNYLSLQIEEQNYKRICTRDRYTERYIIYLENCQAGRSHKIPLEMYSHLITCIIVVKLFGTLFFYRFL